MITITSDVYDPLGYVTFEPVSVPRQRLSRRATLTRTLDANVILDDAGYHPGDEPREFTIPAATMDQAARVERLVTLHSDHLLFDADKVYSGSLSAGSYDPPELSLTFLITEDLSP